jgi:hypothetical protein
MTFELSNSRMNRATCTICASSSLIPIHTLKQYPLSFGSHEGTDEFGDLHFVGCTSCGCVQLQNLIDAETLYKYSHNNTFNTPTWKDHHDQFKTFILEDLSGSALVEFGGYSGTLAERILKERPDHQYTIVDLCNTDPKIPGISFQSGNCETYRCSGDCVILSHVFEHLYNPLKFIKNMNENCVESIYISIPNMNILLVRKNISFLHIEHTYYIDHPFIVSMFQRNGYYLQRSTAFRDHSLFFHFRRGSSDPIVYQNPGLIDRFRNYFIEREQSLKSIIMDRPTFIAPAGHFGQIIYYYLKHYDTNILGCLDNDPTKLNKRVYGTSCTTFRMDHIRDIKEPITILLADSPYASEITEQLLSYNPESHIHVIR